MKTLFTGALALVLLAAPSLAAADQHMHKHGMGQGPAQGMDHKGCGDGCKHGKMGKGGMGGGLVHLLVMNADELKLTDEQIGKLHRLMLKSYTGRQDERKKVRDAKAALKAAMSDASKDEAAIRALAKEKDAAEAAILDQKLKDRKDVLAVLTDAQRKQVKDLKPKWPGKGAPDDDDND